MTLKFKKQLYIRNKARSYCLSRLRESFFPYPQIVGSSIKFYVSQGIQKNINTWAFDRCHCRTCKKYVGRVGFIVGSKAKGRISKRVSQGNKTRQIFRRTSISSPPPDTHTYVCVSGGKKCLFLENLACFFYLRHMFEIRPFALLPTLFKSFHFYFCHLLTGPLAHFISTYHIS